MSYLLILLLTFIFGYLNGMNGTGSIIAPLVYSRALTPRQALALVLVCFGAGPFLFGYAVANAMSSELVALPAVTLPVLLATLGGAVAWISLAAWQRLPCSTTHAFIGSLVGTVVVSFGTQALVAGGLLKTLAALVISPLIGIVAGYGLVRLCRSLSTSATPRINRWYKSGQVGISTLLALAFASNDGQKVIGIVSLSVMAAAQTQFQIPPWSASFTALAMTLGCLLGSQRVLQTLGNRLYAIQPIHGFSAQTASGLVLLSASLLGSPISGSQVIASALVGAGAGERWRKVRWGVYCQIFSTWLYTLPCSALAGAALYGLLAALS